MPHPMMVLFGERQPGQQGCPRSVDAPAEALADCGAFLVSQAVGGSRGVDVARALSGRGTLAGGFNVY